MNLSTIPAAPHAQGFIKVAMEGDPAFGDRRTVNDFLITARHHVVPESGEPRLAEHPRTRDPQLAPAVARAHRHDRVGIR